MHRKLGRWHDTMMRNSESSVAIDHTKKYHRKFSLIYPKYHCNTACIRRKRKRNLKNKEIKSMNEKIQTWSVLNTGIRSWLTHKSNHCIRYATILVFTDPYSCIFYVVNPLSVIFNFSSKIDKILFCFNQKISSTNIFQIQPTSYP